MDRNVLIYSAAREYLDNIKPLGVSLDKYFLGDSRDFSSLKDIYIQFIRSAQNYQSMPKVIKFDERKERISELTCGLDYQQIKDISPEELYQSLRREFNAGGADSSYNCWHKWSKSVVDSAKFISDFSDVRDFVEFVSRFDYNVSTRMALPLLISTKISGVGFALACDTLKELGFTNYSKPDVHMMDVFSALGLTVKHFYTVCYVQPNLRVNFRYCHCPMDSIMLDEVWKRYKKRFSSQVRKKNLGSDFCASWGDEGLENGVQAELDIFPERYIKYQQAIKKLIDNDNVYPIEFDYLTWKQQ